MIEGIEYLSPKAEGCTVGLFKDGAVRIGPWPDLDASRSKMISFRQTPPCLVERGAVHPGLAADEHARPHQWGSSETGEVEIRRSAVGIDESGKTLYYGLGEWVTAKSLADGMRAAGAWTAAELDINWSYTYWLFYGRSSPSAPPQVTSTLVPKIKHSSQGHVAKSSYRDFFYLIRKNH